MLQENFFYHSNSRLGADGGLKEERQLLVEEQKLCKARAHKFSLETNRRKKALEDRRKQWDIQEQRLRENVLQQRRQRVQDATERFQRAHLPPSQRRRQSLRRHVPNIEDALNQIQGALTTYTGQSSFMSSKSCISRSCTPSPKPPSVSKSNHRQALSAVEAYTKLLQEQSMMCLKNSQSTEKTQEQELHSPQGSYLSDCCTSESLSSKDSLENEDPNPTKTLLCSRSSVSLDSEKLGPDQGKQKDFVPPSDLNSFSGMMLFGEHLPQSRKPNQSKQEKQEESIDQNKQMQISKSWGFTVAEQKLKTESQPSLHNCNLLALRDIISADPEHFELNSTLNRPNDSIIVGNIVAPGNTALQSSCPEQEALLDSRQLRVNDDRQLKHPSATEIILPSKNVTSKDNTFGAPPRPNTSLINSATDNASQKVAYQQTVTENYYQSIKKDLPASINNLNKISNLEPKTDEAFNAVSLQHTSLSNIESVAHKCLKCPEEEVQELPVSMGKSHSVCEVRFIKGILKKQSRYMSGDITSEYCSEKIFFAKQVALAIRDSVELTRSKAKDAEGKNTVKKKLRWLDEVDLGKEDNTQNLMKTMKSKSSNLSQSNSNMQDHQLSLTTVSGASRPGPRMTPAASTSYHFTKQAWADVGVQVSLPQKRADEVKVPWSSTRTIGPKVPQRERYARAGAGPVSSRSRKGTVIRPQSATEVSRIAKAQGKIMVPRPPPRIESGDEKALYITKTPYGMDHAGINCKQAPAAEQNPHKDNSEGFLSPYTHHGIRADSGVMYTPLPPTPKYTRPVSEGSMKGTPGSGQQEAQGCSTRRGMMYTEKGLCLHCTPTDEEISQLWNGVRSALATKDDKNCIRRQESGRAVRKVCVEQGRLPLGSGNRKFLQPSQPTKSTTEPVRLFSSGYSVSFPDEGLQSAAQLHLAEVHAEGRLDERGIVTAMETAQTQRPGTVQQCSQQQNLATFSLEEQKILLSLDRLNHQLHCVREHMGGNTGTRGLVLIDSPSTKEVKVTNHHKQRASSANSRARSQRKL